MECFWRVKGECFLHAESVVCFANVSVFRIMQKTHPGVVFTGECVTAARVGFVGHATRPRRSMVPASPNFMGYF